MKKLTTEEFLEAARKMHGNRYDYSLINYVNERTKVKIICLIHGIFMQKPYSHNKIGQGCPKCCIEKRIKSATLSTDEFISKSKQIHGNKYIYSKTKYKHGKIKVEIICKLHGKFLQTPNDHLFNHGCPKCRNIISNMEIEFLNFLKIPDTKENRQFCILQKRVDGYDNKTNTIYEFLGDYWHGNPKKFRCEEYNKNCHKTFGELYNETFEKFKKLKNLGYTIKYIWEADWRRWNIKKIGEMPIQSF